MSRSDATEKVVDLWGDMPVEIVHIIPQYVWHDPSFIVGNRAGLELLHAAIGEALAGTIGIAKVMCNDGEGYRVVIKCVPTIGMQQELCGYTSDIAADRREWPAWMQEADNAD